MTTISPLCMHTSLNETIWIRSQPAVTLQPSVTTSSTHRGQRYTFAPDFVWHPLSSSLVPLLRKGQRWRWGFFFGPREHSRQKWKHACSWNWYSYIHLICRQTVMHNIYVSSYHRPWAGVAHTARSQIFNVRLKMNEINTFFSAANLTPSVMWPHLQFRLSVNLMEI